MGSAPLPQLDRPCLTDAGLETDIVFNRGIDLPHFASITLLRSAEGTVKLTSIWFVAGIFASQR